MVVLLDSYQLERPIDASIVAQKWRIDEHHADELPANVLPLSCAAPLDRESDCVLPAFKNRTISRPHSGLSYSGRLGGSTDRMPKRGMKYQRCHDTSNCARPNHADCTTRSTTGARMDWV